MNAPDTGAYRDVPGNAADREAGHDPPDQTRLRQLADEQAALRRVATLVARGSRPAEIFSAVAEEIGRLLGADNAGVGRFEPDGAAVVVVANVGEDPVASPVGTRVQLRDYLPPALVWRTG